MKRLSLLVAVLSIITGLFSSCGKQSKEATERMQMKTEKKDEAEKIAAFSKRCGAVENWRTNLPQRGLLSVPFTFDLCKAVILSNDFPVLLVMELADVVEHEGKFQAKFSRSYFKNGIFDICLDLNCSPQQATDLLAIQHDNLPGRFALAVRVKMVARPTFGLTGHGSSEDEEGRINVSTDENIFYLKGDCVDLLRLKSDFGWQYTADD